MSDTSDTQSTEEERQANLASVPQGATFPYHKGGGWYVTEEGDVVQGDPEDEDENGPEGVAPPRGTEPPVGGVVTEDSAAVNPGDQAALGTPQPVEVDEADLTDVERLAREHQERNSVERVNRDGFVPATPHPSEREPNPAFGRRSSPEG